MFKPVTFNWRLTKRDMVTKTTKHITDFRRAFVNWYQKERVPQVVKICAKEMRREEL